MTLKEKFQNIHSDFLPLSNNQKNECVLIADDFAIGFAEWIDSDFYKGDDVNKYNKSILEYRESKIFTVKQLLEIYKKEKGL